MGKVIGVYYQIYTQEGKTRFFTEVRSCSKIPYVTVKEMEKQYPGKSFTIIGEIGNLAHAPTNGDKLLMEDGKVIPIFPRGSLKMPFEWVLGYTAVQENSYVAVVGGFFHLIMSIKLIVKIRFIAKRNIAKRKMGIK